MRECPQCGAAVQPGSPECPSCGCGEHTCTQVDHLPLAETDPRSFPEPPLAPVPLVAAAVAAAGVLLAALVSPWALLVVAAAAAVLVVALVRPTHRRSVR